MPSHLKALIRSRRQQTGESYQAALRHIRAQEPGTPPETEGLPRIDELLRDLNVPSTFRVVVGKIPAVGVSADEAVAAELARRRVETPVYVASTGSVQRSISLDQLKALVANGAVDSRHKQMLRTMVGEGGAPLDFSHRCDRCGRWINNGDREREGVCFCGHPYRVAFDLHPRHRWSLRQATRCMECGKQFGYREWVGPRQPWHPFNDGQIRCHVCHLVMVAASEGHDFLCTVGDRSFVLLDVAPGASWFPVWRLSEVFPETATPLRHLASVDFGTKEVLSEVPEANRSAYDQAVKAIRENYGSDVLTVRPLRARNS